jgi:hypothetical protein
VAHWWGISPQTVSLWRKALDVAPVTAGTSRLLRDNLAETWQNGGREKAIARARDPEVRVRMAASRKGKPPPRHVIEAAAAAHRGQHPGRATRRKMSESQKRRWREGPLAARLWKGEEDELVRTLPPPEAARRTGRSLRAVYARRLRLGLPDGRAEGQAARRGKRCP